jgi:hypothetical protein
MEPGFFRMLALNTIGLNFKMVARSFLVFPQQKVYF